MSLESEFQSELRNGGRYDLEMQTVAIVLILYFIALAAVSFTQPKEISWRVAIILRAFLPSWKFFEDYGDIPRLYFRTSTVKTWQPLTPPLQRGRFMLFLNPQGNAALAQASLVQQLLFDLQKFDDVSDFENTVSFELVKALVEREARKQKVISTFQFKVSLVGQKDDDILISPEFRLSPSSIE